MKILVTVKRVTDYEAKLKLKTDNLDIERTQVNMIINPFDEIAIEEALRIKEKLDGEVVVLSIGDSESQNQLRQAMAMGADRGILVESASSISFDMDSFFIAKIIKAIIDKEKPDLVLMGKQAIDDDNQQVSQMLAEIWQTGQATQANTIEINQGKALVKREADGGLETLEVDIPCVITTDLRLNEPRYASLPGIMKAKKKPLEIIPLLSLNISHTPMIKVCKLSHPEVRKHGIKLNSVEELVKKLKEEAKVL